MWGNLQQLIDVQTLLTRFVGYLPNLLSAIILLFVFWLANKLIQKMLGAALQKMDMVKQARGLILRAVKYGIYVFAALTVADQLKINVTSLIAGVGVMGLALSFAAQDTISNIISGVVIIIDGPFREEDWIAIGDLHAVVTEIRLRTTLLTTFDNESVVIPNKQLAQERIINYTMTPDTRVRVNVGIAYKEDMQQARRILLDTLKDDPRILKEPAPVVWVKDLGASSVNMELRFWIPEPIYKFNFMWEYTEKCKDALDRAGIQIPFPHMQLFLEKTDGLRLLATKRETEAPSTQ